MKKLLALTLMLCVSSIVSADLIIGGADVIVNSGDSLGICISSDGINCPLRDVYKLVISGTQVESLSGAAINFPDGTSDPGAIYSGGAGVVYLDFSTGGPPTPIWADPDENTPVVSGIFLTNITDPLVLTLSNINGSIVVDTADVEILPEPATIVLFGLGALLCRKKK